MMEKTLITSEIRQNHNKKNIDFYRRVLLKMCRINSCHYGLLCARKITF